MKMPSLKLLTLPPQVATASLLLLWSQMAGLLANLEKRANAPAESTTPSYQKLPFDPPSLGDSSISQSYSASHVHDQPTVTVEEKSASVEDHLALVRGCSGCVTAIFDRVQKFEAKAAEKSFSTDANSLEEGSSLRENADADLLSSFLEGEAVDSLINFSMEVLDPMMGPLTTNEAVDSCSADESSTRVGTLDNTSPRQLRDISSLENITMSSQEARALISQIFHSSLFNFCLDKLVEARNRFVAKTVFQEAQSHPGPPTLGLHPQNNIISTKPIGIDNDVSARLLSATSAMRSTAEIQSIVSSGPAYDDSEYVRRSKLEEISSENAHTKLKIQRLEKKLAENKRAREVELRDEARARRNLKVQLSAQLALFRAISELASAPLEVIGSDNEGSTDDSKGTSGGYLSEVGLVCDDMATRLSATERRAAFHRRSMTTKRSVPQLAVPIVPAELASVLRNEKIYSMQIKTAVESVVSLKADQMELLVANLALEETLKQHMKQERLLNNMREFPPPSRVAHRAPTPILESPVLQPSTPLMCRPNMRNMCGDNGQPRMSTMSPILRPMQSSPHVVGEGMRYASPHIDAMPHSQSPLFGSGPFPPASRRHGDGQATSSYGRWSPEWQRRSLPDLIYAEGPRNGPPSTVVRPFSSFTGGDLGSLQEQQASPLFRGGVSALHHHHGPSHPLPLPGGGGSLVHNHFGGGNQSSITDSEECCSSSGGGYHNHSGSMVVDRRLMENSHQHHPSQFSRSMSFVNDGGAPSPNASPTCQVGCDGDSTTKSKNTLGLPKPSGSKVSKNGTSASLLPWTHIKKTFQSFAKTGKSSSKQKVLTHDDTATLTHTHGDDMSPNSHSPAPTQDQCYSTVAHYNSKHRLV